MSDTEREGELPFECEWEIGVHPAGHPNDWAHYHPLARSRTKAEEKAKREARDDMMSNPVVKIGRASCRERV